MPSPVRYHQNHSPMVSVLHFSAVLSVTMVWLLFVPPRFSIVVVRLLGGKISPGGGRHTGSEFYKMEKVLASRFSEHVQGSQGWR